VDKSEPIDMDIEDAFSVLVDSTEERLDISLLDSEGEEIASVSGTLVGPPEAIEQDGQRFGELVVSRDGMRGVVHIPVDPETRCTIAEDGSMTGNLPNGGSWSVTYPDAEPFFLAGKRNRDLRSL